MPDLLLRNLRNLPVVFLTCSGTCRAGGVVLLLHRKTARRTPRMARTADTVTATMVAVRFPESTNAICHVIFIMTFTLCIFRRGGFSPLSCPVLHLPALSVLLCRHLCRL